MAVTLSIAFGSLLNASCNASYANRYLRATRANVGYRLKLHICEI